MRQSQAQLENLPAREILAGALQPGDTIAVDVQAGRLAFRRLAT